MGRKVVVRWTDQYLYHK